MRRKGLYVSWAIFLTTSLASGMTDSWSAKLANFAGEPASPTLALSRGMCESASDVAEARDPVRVSAIRAGLLARPIFTETSEVPLRLRLASGVLVPSDNQRREAVTNVYGQTVCVTQVLRGTFARPFAPGESVELAFDVARAAQWEPYDFGWRTAVGRVHSMRGIVDCTQGNHVDLPTGADVVRTPYALQPLGYMFRGHSILLPLLHVGDPRAGWHAEGEGIVGVFVRNGAIVRADFGKGSARGMVDVTAINWNLANLKKLWADVNERIRDGEEEERDLARLVRPRVDSVAALARVRRELAILRKFPSVHVHFNDQRLTPGATQMSLVYDRDVPVERRPVLWNTLDGKLPVLPGLSEGESYRRQHSVLA